MANFNEKDLKILLEKANNPEVARIAQEQLDISKQNKDAAKEAAKENAKEVSDLKREQKKTNDALKELVSLTKEQIKLQKQTTSTQQTAPKKNVDYGADYGPQRPLLEEIKGLVKELKIAAKGDVQKRNGFGSEDPEVVKELKQLTKSITESVGGSVRNLGNDIFKNAFPGLAGMVKEEKPISSDKPKADSSSKGEDTTLGLSKVESKMEDVAEKIDTSNQTLNSMLNQQMETNKLLSQLIKKNFNSGGSDSGGSSILDLTGNLFKGGSRTAAAAGAVEAGVGAAGSAAAASGGAAAATGAAGSAAAASGGAAAATGAAGGAAQGVSKWSKFLTWMEKRAPSLFKRFMVRAGASLAGLAIPGPGWVWTAVSILGSVSLAYEVYEAWKEFSGGGEEESSKSFIDDIAEKVDFNRGFSGTKEMQDAVMDPDKQKEILKRDPNANRMATQKLSSERSIDTRHIKTDKDLYNESKEEPVYTAMGDYAGPSFTGGELVAKAGETTEQKSKEGIVSNKSTFGSEFLGALLSGKGLETGQFLGQEHTRKEFTPKDGGEKQNTTDLNDIFGKRTSGGLFGSDKYEVYMGDKKLVLDKSDYMQMQKWIANNESEKAIALFNKLYVDKNPTIDQQQAGRNNLSEKGDLDLSPPGFRSGAMDQMASGVKKPDPNNEFYANQKKNAPEDPRDKGLSAVKTAKREDERKEREKKNKSDASKATQEDLDRADKEEQQKLKQNLKGVEPDAAPDTSSGIMAERQAATQRKEENDAAAEKQKKQRELSFEADTIVLKADKIVFTSTPTTQSSVGAGAGSAGGQENATKRADAVKVSVAKSAAAVVAPGGAAAEPSPAQQSAAASDAGNLGGAVPSSPGGAAAGAGAPSGGPAAAGAGSGAPGGMPSGAGSGAPGGMPAGAGGGAASPDIPAGGFGEAKKGTGDSGKLSDSELAPIGQGGHRAQPAAANAFKAMRAAAKADGVDLTVSDSYRSYDAQVKVKREKPNLAATPGKSNHGWGLAFDMGFGGDKSSKGFKWMAANAAKFGITGPLPKPDEAWHWTYTGGGDPSAMKDAQKGGQKADPAKAVAGEPAPTGGGGGGGAEAKTAATEAKAAGGAPSGGMGGGSAPAAPMPAAPSTGANLSAASSNDISSQRSADKNIQADASNGASGQTPPAGKDGNTRFDKENVGMVEPADAAKRFKDLFGMAA